MRFGVVCASISGVPMAEMDAALKEAAAQGAHMVELRLDTIPFFHAASHLRPLLLLCRLPAIISYRPTWAGGEYDGDENARLQVLELAAELGAAYVDVELQVAEDFLARLKKKTNITCKTVVSHYSCKSSLTEEELKELAKNMQQLGADVVRIVSAAEDITDVAPMFRLLASSSIPSIFVATGERGHISQLLAPKFGAFLTMGAFDFGQDVPHNLQKLLDLTKYYKAARVNEKTEVFGLISCPVSHSIGWKIHNAAFMESNYNGIYVPFLVDDLARFFKAFNEFNFSGFSVGIPYKADILQFCDEVDSMAQAMGAVNTIVRRKTDGKLIGYNTDCEAAISAIEDAWAERQGLETNVLQDKLFVLIGSGGAGKAIAFGAKQRGARVVVTDYYYEKAEELAQSIGARAIKLDMLDNFAPESGMILANASPVGMHPNVDRSPIKKAALKNYSLVFDAIYNPGKTKLLCEAVESGAIAVSGLEMFIRQATAQFELFTGGRDAPRKQMRQFISSLYNSP